MSAIASTLTPADVPIHLATATIKAATAATTVTTAAGVVSTQVFALASAVTKAMWIAKIKIVSAVVLAPTLAVAATVLAVQMRDTARPSGQAASTKLRTPAVPLSPAVEKLIAQLDEQAVRLKNLTVSSEAWEETNTEHGVGEWKRNVAYTSVTAWYEGLPSTAARLDYHRQVRPWIQGARPITKARTPSHATEPQAHTSITTKVFPDR